MCVCGTLDTCMKLYVFSFFILYAVVFACQQAPCSATVINKLWYFLRTHFLTIPRFDLFLQGALLIVILLDHNVYLLLGRDADTGYSTPLIEDWVLMGAAGAEFLLGAFVAWWGKGRRNFALSAWLAAAAVSGLIILAFPFKRPNLPAVDLCEGGQISALSLVDDGELDPLATPRTAFLIISAVICSLTKVSIWSHGLTYLDDHEPQSGPYFYGILISIRISLGLTGQNWLRPGAVRDDWWVAQLSLSMLTLMYALFFMLFPRTMRGSEALIEERDSDSGFFSSLGRVVRNKVLILQVGALGFLNVGLFGFFHYDRNFIQAMYHIEAEREDLRSARLVGSIFRPLVIVFFIMVFRVRFSVRRNDGVKATTGARVGGIVSIFVAIFFLVVAFIGCDVGDVAGMESGSFDQPGCSLACGCTSERYGFAPVCELDSTTTYFSPCHAGCSQYEDLNGFLVFNNCTCATSHTVRGACALPNCQLVYSLYQVFMATILAIAGASMLMQGMVFLRAVERRDKPVAIGFLLAAVALIAHVFGHLLYMLISYLTCAFSHEGVCLFHRPTLFSMAVVSAAMAILSAVVSVIASKVAANAAKPAGSENGFDTR